MTDDRMTTSIQPLVDEVRKALRKAGLHVDGSVGQFGPAGLLEVRDAPRGEWLFAVGIRWTDFNVRAGICRTGETILDSWPHDEGGHVDGRCFLFTHADQSRKAAFLAALSREIAVHCVPDKDGLFQALSKALPGAEADDLRAVAAAVGAGLPPGTTLAIERRLQAYAAEREAAEAPAP
jgi:hypothetical protein